MTVCATTSLVDWLRTVPGRAFRPHGYITGVADLNRRNLMLMTGLGALTAALPVGPARASVGGR